MRVIFAILLATCAIVSSFSQTYSYEYVYDASGNRTTRTQIQLASLKGASAYDSETKQFDTSIKPEVALKEQLKDLTITLYPNPTRGELIVEIDPFTSGMEGELEVVSLEGKTILHKAYVDAINLLDLTDEPAGNYLLRLRVGEEIKVYTLIKN